MAVPGILAVKRVRHKKGGRTSVRPPFSMILYMYILWFWFHMIKDFLQQAHKDIPLDIG